MEIDTLLEVVLRRQFLRKPRLSVALSLHEEVGKMLVTLEARIRSRNYRRGSLVPSPYSLTTADD